MVTLASIYSQPPGYVTEGVDLDSAEENPRNFRTLQELEKYVLGRGKSEYLHWQISLSMMERAYVDSPLQTVSLIRIPIVGACAERPKGYIDKFNSVSFLMYEVGLGKVSELKGRNANIIDMIPADYVSNFMLMVGLRMKENEKNVYNLSTSSLNPLRVGRWIETIESYWNQNPPRDVKSAGNQHRVSVRVYETESTYGIMQLRNRIPRFLVEKSADLFDLKTTKIELAKEKIKNKRQVEIAEKYSYFLSNEWICSANKCIDIYNRMSPEERRLFPFNLNMIDWKHYLSLYLFGIQKYILGHNV